MLLFLVLISPMAGSTNLAHLSPVAVTYSCLFLFTAVLQFLVIVLLVVVNVR